MTIPLLSSAAWSALAAPPVALWTDAANAYALLPAGELFATGLIGNAYPALSPRHPGAAWFERLAHDQTGATATGALDTRPAIGQSRGPDGAGAWPDFPLPAIPGAHQLALGPVQGVIEEPVHLRVSALGEQVLSLQTRLGYAHRGTLALIRGKSPRLAARFAARVAGDATVAHAQAFAQAAEAALSLRPPPRAVALRAVMAELERCAVHLDDLARLAGAAGFLLLEARLGAQREMLCEAAHAAFGHRLMMDLVIPGGVAGDIAADGPAALKAALAGLAAELPDLTRLFEDHAGLHDRLAGIGVIPPGVAAAYGAGGVVARASGQRVDARLTPGSAPYAAAALSVPVENAGDCAARSRIRLAELAESLRLLRLFLDGLPEGIIARPPPSAGDGEPLLGLGVAESPRGPVWHFLSIASGAIADVFIADASALHWPLLEQAAAGSALSDLALIMRSINPSVAAVDL